MKWVMIKKGNIWKRRLVFEAEDWLCLVIITGIAVIMLLSELIRRM